MMRSDMYQSQEQQTAFSLLELLAVVTILGIIAVVVIPRITGSVYLAKGKCCYHNCAQINAAAERWYIEKGTWPNNDPSVDMGADPDYFPDGIPVCPVSGHKYRLQGVTHRVIGHNSSGGKWGGHL